MLKWNDMVAAPRRFLPSTTWLRAFEAAARTGSVTLAARELDLTQSAVSRQILALESSLEVTLFHREKQSIRLTLAGDAYARQVREALRKISSASLTLRANPMGGTLTLACLPTFAARWLVPRLPDFLASHRQVTVNILTRLVPFDFAREPFDAAIHFGAPVWPGADMLTLFSETTLPMCAPALLREHAFATPQSLRAARLLHLDSRPDAWEQWLAGAGAASDGVSGMLFDQFSTLTTAAVSGLGVALLPTILVEQERASGSLVVAFDRALDNAQSYHLVWPSERMDHPPLTAFRTWLGRQRLSGEMDMPA